jgi:hypothetical protein
MCSRDAGESEEEKIWRKDTKHGLSVPPGLLRLLRLLELG